MHSYYNNCNNNIVKRPLKKFRISRQTLLFNNYFKICIRILALDDFYKFLAWLNHQTG